MASDRRDELRKWVKMHFVKLGLSEEQILEKAMSDIAKVICKLKISYEEYLEIAKDEINICKNEKSPTLTDENVDIGDVDDDKTYWSNYKKKLEKNKFNEIDIKNIEESTKEVLKRLTKESNKIIKGLVLGNVQSGKTANMAALMSMAADNGFNMFIMLAGSKNTLKKQSNSRLKDDLDKEFVMIEDLDNPEKEEKRPTYIIAIKSPDNLKKLKEYLFDYKKYIENKKIIILDDESDEASINTSRDKETRINSLIKDILEGKTDSGEIKYGAMNYIGYTATPYANIFGYNGEHDLFPDFVHTLSNSSIYFGPEQIFGINGDTEEYDEKFPGLSILNSINEKDASIVSGIDGGRKQSVPKNSLKSLKDAICYFYCSVACIRYWRNEGKIDPSSNNAVTMMIHSNHTKNSHANLSKAIKNWLEKVDKKEFIENCKNVWGEQTKQFSLKAFKKQFKSYGIENITDYPKFTDLKKYIIDNTKIHTNENKKSKINTSGDALNLFEINNNKINKDIYRVTDDQEMIVVPYILVGGNILSRGLTLERLVVSYFIRDTKLGDTLMQRGRWFGYRAGYELLPRIWMTDDVKERFKEMTITDRKLREALKDIESDNKNLRELFIPLPKKTQITAADKSRGLEKMLLSYRGGSTASNMIPKNAIESNLALTDKFISECKLTQGKRKHNRYAYISKNISYSDIKKYVEKFKHDNAEMQKKWLQRYEENHENAQAQGWNVILVSKKEANNGIWQSKIGDINAVERKYDEANKDKYVFSSIMVFRDLLDDIDDDISQSEITSEDISNLRKKADVDKTPQLLIYIIGIDKNTKIAAIVLNLPGNPNNKDKQEGGAIKYNPSNSSRR